MWGEVGGRGFFGGWSVRFLGFFCLCLGRLCIGCREFFPIANLYYHDMRIPARTPVGMSALLVHSNADINPEPECFKPD